MAHPEYQLENRLLLDKINWADGTIEIEGKTHTLRDTNFPTVDRTILTSLRTKSGRS